jgi:hypothetical protein
VWKKGLFAISASRINKEIHLSPQLVGFGRRKQLAYSAGIAQPMQLCHPAHRDSAANSTIILPGQSERSDARFSG